MHGSYRFLVAWQFRLKLKIAKYKSGDVKHVLSTDILITFSISEENLYILNMIKSVVPMFNLLKHIRVHAI